MENLDLPIQSHIVYEIEEHFNYGCKILKHNQKEKIHIVLIKNSDLKEINYYVVIYRNIGYVVCYYSQKFSSLLGAIVIYKKLKHVLNKNILKRIWKEVINTSKRTVSNKRKQFRFYLLLSI